MTTLRSSVRSTLRKGVREGLRGLAGPTLFDAAVQFGRMPVWTDLRARATSSYCIFVEPHFDDVAFSCGGLLTDLSQKDVPIEMVTVFTEGANSTETLSPLARQLHEEWNAPNNPYERRRKEARAAIETLGVHCQWLGLREALYRDPGLTSIDELLSFESAPDDLPTLDTLTQLLSEKFEQITQQRTKPVLIFAPLGVGGHLDHLLVHDAVRTATSRLDETTTWYYEDFPYVLQTEALKERVQQLENEGRPTTVDIRSTVEARIDLSSRYRSQVDAIFETPEQLEEDIRNHASFVGTPDRPRERFWRA